MTSEQRVGIGFLVLMGAVVGALAAPAPTGQVWVDAVYRAVFVVVVTVAGSRARRWALVTSAAIVSVSSFGIILAVSLLSLALAVLLVGRRRRDRVWGAAVGTLVSVAGLGLQIDWFRGASALMAGVAATLIVFSGYRYSPRVTRRWVRRIVAIYALLLGVGVVAAGALALTTREPASDGVSLAKDAVDSARSGRPDEASEGFEKAADVLGDVLNDTTAWWTIPIRLVPGVNQNVELVHVVSESGERLARAAGAVSRGVDYDRIQRPDGGIDVSALAEFQEPVSAAAQTVRAARAELVDLDRTWIVPELASRVDEFSAQVDDLADETELAEIAVQDGPALLGANGVRRYLVLLGNPAEMRDLGGHIGNWAELEIDAGRISLVDVGLPAELSRPDGEARLSESGEFPERVLDALPARFPQNWGVSLDFELDARLASRLYAEATLREVDGVMYADPEVLAALLQIVGPVPIPSLGRELDAGNAVEFLTSGQYSAFPTQSAGDLAVTGLVRVLFEQLVQTRLPSPQRLSELFGPLRKQGRMRFVSARDEDARLLGALGLNVALPRADDATDFLAIVQSNANPSKIDQFLHRETSIGVEWNPATGEVVKTITVRLRNDAPPSGLPDYVIGNGNGRPFGTNSLDLAVLSGSKELTAVTEDGVEIPRQTTADGPGFRHQVRVHIPAGESRVVQFVLTDEVDSGNRYQLFFAGQPALNEAPVALEIRSTEGRIVGGPGLNVSGGVATASVPSAENSRISVVNR